MSWLADEWQFAVEVFDHVQQLVFEQLVQPALFSLGQGVYLEDAFVGTQGLLLGLLQLLFMVVIWGALERWKPAELVSDRAAIRTDVIYTLIHRLGLFRLVMFVCIAPLTDSFLGWAAVHGVSGFYIDQWFTMWWPGLTDTAFFSFLLYLLVFDFVDYWIHRGQHRVNRWWALHALHHSQQQMTLWSDNRNHLLDDMLRDLIMVFISRFIGVPPEQFLVLLIFTQLMESLSHANTRIRVWPWLERLIVTPRFHRVHHGIGVGHESNGPGSLGGCNFAVLFPVWDVLFGTADYKSEIGPTGIRDQLPDMGSRDYGHGFWKQQWLGLTRLLTSN